MASRPSRRVARRAIIESDDEDEISLTSNAREESPDFEPEQPAPKKTRTARRSVPSAAAADTSTTSTTSTKPTKAPKAPRTRRRPKKAPTPSETVDNSDILGEDEISQANATATPKPRRTKRASTVSSVDSNDHPDAADRMDGSVTTPGGTSSRKRRSVASRRSRASNAPEAQLEAQPEAQPEARPETPKPKASRSPEVALEDQMSPEDQSTPKARPASRSKVSSTPKPAARLRSATPQETRSQETQAVQPTPAPKPSQPSIETPHAQRLGSPLTDITSNVNTVKAKPPPSAKPVRTMDTIMEKPMDIVLKSRTLTIPIVEDLTPKPRIVITHLVLENFKSYAGRQDVGPFHASFSSVVGPNGSGKSNVIDSLLFVFGFRASKMRQGKISALIHSSAQYPNLPFCEVAVHFQKVLDQVGAFISLRTKCPQLTASSLGVAMK